MSNKRSLSLIALVVLIIVSVVVVRSVAAKRRQQTLTLPDAESEYFETYTEELTCTGRPKPGGERYAAVQSGGRLEALNIKVGDTVTQGQILAVIDRTLNASKLKSALSSFRLAQKDYGRLAGLVRSGSASHDEFDKAQSTLEVKRAELEEAKQKVEDSMVRAPSDGRVSVVIFKAGDKIPDGSRIAAIETPGSLQMPCRVSTASAARLPPTASAVWTNLEQATAAGIPATTVIDVPTTGDFLGVDREIRLATEDHRLGALERRRVQVKIPLRPQTAVTKLPSSAIVKRQDGYYAVVAPSTDTLQWAKVDILKRDAADAYVTGLAPDAKLKRLTEDISKIDAVISSRSGGDKSDQKSNKG